MQKLHSLELQGYKTFASKTKFEFPDPITAIVGPNGSGKSNIADAVRWVLGEQAYSLLRGKRTEDMIFAGSEGRSRSSMASASITFDNENQWLPIDFSEVTIARRAYRNGENEYLINNQKVRLKEINEILANAGLAERTYTIIGQGLVDTALSLRPEERRLFFEEAAGIGLYRARRDEALQKLDNTRRNMERAQDILSEIKPRLTKLQLQTEKVKDYERRKADLSLLLKDWYGYEWNHLQSQLIEILDAKKIQEQKLFNTKDRMKEIESQLDIHQTNVEKARLENSEYHHISANLHIEIQKISENLAVLNERHRLLMQNKTELEHRLLTVGNQLAQVEDQDEIFIKQKNDVEEQCTQTRNELNSIQLELQKSYEAKNSIEQELNNIQHQKIEIEKTIISRTTKLEEATQHLEYLKNNLQQNEEIAKTQALKINQKQKTLEELISEQANVNEKLILRKQELSQIEQLIEKLNNEIDEVHSKISKNEIFISSKEKQIEIINEAESSFLDYTSGAKSIVEILSKGKKDEKISTLLTDIQITQGYELAITTLIGDYLEGIVIEGLESPENILEMVEERNERKTYLLFSDLMKNNKNQGIKLGKEGAKPAIEFVQSKKFDHILQTILKNSFVVGNRKDAIKLIDVYESNIIVATKNGEVFLNKGIVQAGRTTVSKTFERRRERDRLLQEVRDMQEQVNQYSVDSTKQSLLVERKQRERSEKENEISSLELSFNEMDDSINALNADTSNIEHSIKIYQSQNDNIKKEIVIILNEIEKLNNQLIDYKNQIDNIKNKENNLYQKLKSIITYELNQKDLDLKSQLIIFEEKQVNLLSRIDELIKNKDSLSNQKNEIASLLNKTDNEIIEIENNRAKLIKRNKEIEEELKEIKQKIVPSEKLLDENELSRQELFSHLEKARQLFNIADRQFMQIEVQEEKTKNDIENLKAHISEDFGIIAYDYPQDLSGPTPLPIDGIVDSLPKIKELPQSLLQDIKQQKAALKRMGAINPEAQTEYQDLLERSDFLSSQLEDLTKAERDLRKIVLELDGLMRDGFNRTFKEVNEEFSKIFKKLFGGGTAQLKISDEEHISETGIDIEATLPGRRKQELALLSGGERSLAAVALIFALLKISPTPFCVLDEVDAMLDESNVIRFGELLRELSRNTQFIVITHNRHTVQLADVIYGVTMGKDQTSQVISLKLDELTDELVQ